MAAPPDHGGGFPGERADEFLLAAEGDHERRLFTAFHQYDGRSEIEVGWLGLRFIVGGVVEGNGRWRRRSLRRL